MKALDILEDLKQILFRDYNIWSGYTKKDFNKAIKELEDLQNRKCANCKFYYDYKGICNSKKCQEMFITTYKGLDSEYGCNYFEPKE